MFSDLVKKCEALVKDLVPDVQFECWKSPTVDKVDEALLLWSFIVSDLGESPEAEAVTQTLVEMKRQLFQRRRVSEVDLTDAAWAPPVGYRALKDVFAENGSFWWHNN